MPRAMAMTALINKLTSLPFVFWRDRVGRLAGRGLRPFVKVIDRQEEAAPAGSCLDRVSKAI